MITVTPKRAFVDVNGKGRLLSGRIVARRDSKVFVLVDNDDRFDDWYTTELISEVD